jgi:DNA-directed RNA polymerase
MNLAKLTIPQVISCIGNLFHGAQDIQNWLNICARLISKSIPPERLASAMDPPKKTRAKRPANANRVRQEQMTTVVWTTPLGLPIVQPYRQTKRKQVHTSLQTVYISDPNTPATGEFCLRCSSCC